MHIVSFMSKALRCFVEGRSPFFGALYWLAEYCQAGNNESLTWIDSLKGKSCTNSARTKRRETEGRGHIARAQPDLWTLSRAQLT